MKGTYALGLYPCIITIIKKKKKGNLNSLHLCEHNTPKPNVRLHQSPLKMQKSDSNDLFLDYYANTWTNILKLIYGLWASQLWSHACPWGQGPDSLLKGGRRSAGQKRPVGTTITETNVLFKTIWITALALYFCFPLNQKCKNNLSIYTRFGVDEGKAGGK